MKLVKLFLPMSFKYLTIILLLLPLSNLIVESVSAQDSDTLREVSIVKQKLLLAGEGHSVQRFDKVILDKYRHDEISKLLSEKAGFYLKTNGPNGLATLSIRGLSANHTKLYWNNISISSPTLGLSDLSLLPSAFFDQVNINVGAAGLIDGSGGQGGSINLLNASSIEQGHKVGLMYRVNPLLNSKSRILSHGWNDGKFEVQTNLLLQDAENDFPYFDRSSIIPIKRKRENAGLKRLGFANNYFYRIRKGEELSIKLMYMQNDKDLPSVIGASDNMQNQNDKSWRGLLTWHKNKESYYHGVGIARTKDYSNYQDQVVIIDSEFDIDVLTAYYHIGYKIMPKIIVGAKITGTRSNVESSGFDGDVIQNNLSILGTLDYDLPKNGGVVLSVRKETTSESDHGFTPALSVFIRPFDKSNLKLKASFAKNIRIPTLNDLYYEIGGNPNLLDEKSINVESGLEFEQDKFKFEGVYYYSLTDNWIQWLPQNGGVWSPVNIRKVRSEGVELALTLRPNLKKVISRTFQVRYTYNIASNIDSKQSELLIGKELIFTPNHQVALNSSLGYKDWRFSFEQKITSKIYLDPMNERYLPYMAPANFVISYLAFEREERRMMIDMTINNIFDEEYQVQPNFPMPMRNITMSVSLNF
ncbi:MAG: vitamin B12 transporter [Flavobacteriales bacterium]